MRGGMQDKPPKIILEWYGWRGQCVDYLSPVVAESSTLQSCGFHDSGFPVGSAVVPSCCDETRSFGRWCALQDIIDRQHQSLGFAPRRLMEGTCLLK